MMTNGRRYRFTQWKYVPNSPDPDMPHHWVSWYDLCDLCPVLDVMHTYRWFNQKPPPRPMSNAAFVAFAACFADRTKREILRTLILDAIGDDIVKLIEVAIQARK